MKLFSVATEEQYYRESGESIVTLEKKRSEVSEPRHSTMAWLDCDTAMHTRLTSYLSRLTVLAQKQIQNGRQN
jgi:hypothetical protein